MTAAIASAEAFFAALNTGDVDEIVALVDPDDADRRMLEHNAAIAAAYPFEVSGCTGGGATDELVMVDCAINMSDPVFVALGATEIVYPWWV